LLPLRAHAKQAVDGLLSSGKFSFSTSHLPF
jgi:hypothetical protein